MEALLEPQSRRANLLLHCGAHAVDRVIIGSTPTPEPTVTWTPLPHMALIDEVEQVLTNNGLSIVNQAHSLTHDGLRYFGLMEIQNGVIHRDYAWVLGLRNSHDKTFPAGIVAGANVFICDNLSFSGEIKIARKHTRFILRDLPFLTERAIGRLMERWHHQDERISAYKGKNLSDSSAHDLIIRSTDVRACTPRQIPAILKEWRNPRHEEFQARTLWTLFNSFTEVLKGNLNELPKRTEALHGLLDTYVGLPQFSQN
ncbi:MAG TPA: DUF932 domain-containing protein [Candidatus Udaeobacter sp.]|nr:DUF932 domain-containing protein [Candidatus Udaeobacter sp.]